MSYCSNPPVEPPAFMADRAYGYLLAQVDFGPRVPGSEASAQCRSYVYKYFSDLGLEVDSQAFLYFDPYSKRELRLVNVIASFKADPPQASPGIVLMAHYDSRPRTDYASDANLKDQPIVGANDGASGVAVLMEMANMFAEVPPPTDVDLVIVDGEDWGKVGDHQHYVLGSREFVNRGVRGKYLFGIVVDMVGDADQQIYREVYSEHYNKELNDVVWDAAARLGVATFRDSVKYTILDDHLSLNTGGVPAIDIIDFDYPYWHTEFDTPDKCSGESLAEVGKVLAEVIYHPSLWPRK